MENLGIRIKNLREQNKLTQGDLAEKLGTTKQSVSNYENGKRRPDYETLETIADIFNVNMNFLLGYDDKIDELIRKIPNLHPVQWIRRIPILGTIACGNPIFADENIDGYIGIDTTHMRGDFALRCNGDSMTEAEIYDGDIVLLKKTSDVDNGKIAAVVIEDEATLKKVYKQENTVILQPCNTSYAPIVLDITKEEQIYIIGECVGVYHTLEQ